MRGLTYGPQLCCLLSHRSCDCGTLHFTLRIDDLVDDSISHHSGTYYMRAPQLQHPLSYATIQAIHCHTAPLFSSLFDSTPPHMASPFLEAHRSQSRLTTPALSSKYRYTPSDLLHGLLCLTTTAGMTFFRSSGFPFLTVAITMSPTPAAGRRLRRAPMPFTEIM